MKISQFVEKYFWAFLLAGMILGLVFPVYPDFFMSLVKPILMLMLFLVFLKTDAFHVIEAIKDYKLMLYIVGVRMLVIPLIFYLFVKLTFPSLAISVLLLTAMPAGVSTPSLTDLVKGSIPLSLGIVIITSITAPFTVPLLFGILDGNNLNIDLAALFADLAFIVFLPMILSQVIKRLFDDAIKKQQHLFTSFNVFLLFLIVYAIMGAQRDLIVNDVGRIFSQMAFLYMIFIMLHIAGYTMGFRQSRENKIALAIGTAYMNNGMAIVLAASHFDPSVMIMMVISEIPWNTLPAPFRRVLRYLR
jgi:BASS family bile acid:Na+ symporter